MYSRVACVFLCIVWCICAVLVYFYPRRPLWAAPRWPVFQLNPNFLFPEIEQLSNYTITQLLMVTGESMEQLAWPSLWRAASQSQHFMLYNWSIFPAKNYFLHKNVSLKYFLQVFWVAKIFQTNIAAMPSELQKNLHNIHLLEGCKLFPSMLLLLFEGCEKIQLKYHLYFFWAEAPIFHQSIAKIQL